MTDQALPRQLAQSTLEALKKGGHIVLALGETEAVLRELADIIDPVLKRILPRIARSAVMGEVTSTFGDEATDEAVEELVTDLREALLDSDGVEDVFTEDRDIERAIFRILADELRAQAARGEDHDDEVPPISVRLETLGYVATAAAKSADDGTLKDALERAAEAAKSELETYDSKSRTAFFRGTEADPDRRIDIESAIEEELSELVDLGLLPLPTIVRDVELGGPVGKDERRTLSRTLDALVDKHLKSTICPGTWEWTTEGTLRLVFTPLAEPDEELVTRMTDAFTRDLVLAMPGKSKDADGAAPSKRDVAPPPSARPRPAPPENVEPPREKRTKAASKDGAARGDEAKKPATKTAPKKTKAAAPKAESKPAPKKRSPRAS
ncbi:MAG TPA: hypothetical protein VL400_12245 [Polyangiaceae bacterium]|nr:hypothetical protein [Polyangiaceae bacterium]